MATINEWNAEKLEEYSSLYPWLGTEVFLVVGVAIFFLFFCVALFRFDREDYDKKADCQVNRCSRDKLSDAGWGNSF